MNALYYITSALYGNTQSPVSVIEGDAKLPVELEQHIFKMAAFNDPKTTSRLLRVSKRAFYWLYPQLYNSMILTDLYPTEGPRLKYFGTLSPKNTNMRENCKLTKYLVVGEGKDTLTTGCLKAMPNVTHLLTRQPNHCSEELARAITALPLQQLYFITGYMTEIMNYSTSHPNLRWQNLTHLLYYGTLAEPLDLRHFPAITHFASSTKSIPTTIVPFERESFRVCIFFTMKQENPEEWKSQYMEEPRLVFLRQRHIIPVMLDLSLSFWGDIAEVWKGAEAVVEEQRAAQ
ncbi:hypothetical protein DL96DRAFT_1585095 [Flagelloscypha sp. PMI_526]|nr:hypothetical protein DL96DRAFT_1585095 [Flagelloscypha sp. PMI_526]